jgi:hypothetical protein
MANVTADDLTNYIEANIPEFHRRRLESLTKLKLKKVLERKNAYLFKAKNVVTAADFVKAILDAYLSSQEETVFGTFLEGLAIFICKRIFHGRKSSTEGIDLEFERDDIRYIVAIKSGPKWGNSSQIKRMRENFKQAKRILGTNTSKFNIVAVNGCCYGRDSKPDKSDYLKLCGERFWEFVSGNPLLYLEIIEPLGHRAKERNEEFAVEYAKVVNRFTRDFITEFCNADGAIEWEKIVRINSSVKIIAKSKEGNKASKPRNKD